MQAIQTKFHGPTNTKGSRIIATAWAGRITLPYRHALNAVENHREAALTLASSKQWGWTDDSFVTGQLVNESYVHVSKEF